MRSKNAAVIVLLALGPLAEPGWAGTTPASAECEAKASVAGAESTLPIELCCVPPS